MQCGVAAYDCHGVNALKISGWEISTRLTAPAYRLRRRRQLWCEVLLARDTYPALEALGGLVGVALLAVIVALHACAVLLEHPGALGVAVRT